MAVDALQIVSNHKILPIAYFWLNRVHHSKTPRQPLMQHYEIFFAWLFLFFFIDNTSLFILKVILYRLSLSKVFKHKVTS
jgi:tellurite resistance protein TehA-like permease